MKSIPGGLEHIFGEKFEEILWNFLLDILDTMQVVFEKSLEDFGCGIRGKLLISEYFSDGLTSIGKEDASNDASNGTKI